MNQRTSSIHMTNNSFSHASFFFFFFSLNFSTYRIWEPFISSHASTATIFLIEKTLIERTTCKVSDWSTIPFFLHLHCLHLHLVFHLDSTIPFLFIISLSFSFSFLVHDVAGLCGFVRFGEVFHNFRDPITQRYGIAWGCLIAWSLLCILWTAICVCAFIVFYFETLSPIIFFSY